jgi:ribosomal protein S4
MTDGLLDRLVAGGYPEPEARQLLLLGRVRLNGAVVSDPDRRVAAGSAVAVLQVRTELVPVP